MNNKLAFIYPPDKEHSLRHRKANRIFRKIDLSKITQERCNCCGKFVAEDSQTSCIFYDPELELEFLGAGVPLLFSFLQNVFVLVIVFILIVAFQALISNFLSNSCSKSTINCMQSMIRRMSISNKISDGDSITVQIYLITLMTVIWAFFNQYIIFRLRKVDYQADFNIQTPSDYAILISSLPQSATEFDIRKMIASKFEELSEQDKKNTSNLAIKNIIIPKKLDQYHLQQLKQEKEFLKAIKKKKHSQYKKPSIPLSDQIAKVAIVIFYQEISKQFFLEKNSLVASIKNIFCNWGAQISNMMIKDHHVVINRAPEPDDIIWNNLGKSPRSIFLHKVLTYLLSIILLFISGAIQYLLAHWEVSQSENTKIISLLSSVIVHIVNHLITFLLVYSTKKEGNLTFTMESQSLTIKIVIFQFINSGVFYTFANALAVNFDQIILEEIFSYKVTVFMMINAISTPAMTFIQDYFQVSNLLERWLFQKDIIYLTQKQCNQLYELPDCEIPFKYAYIVSTLWLTFFFTPFVPVVSIISLIGFIFYYFVCKFLFRFAYRLPHVRSNQINTISLWLTYSLPAVLNVGQFLIFRFIDNHVNVYISYSTQSIFYTSLTLSLLWIIVPWYQINAKLFTFSETTNENYNENAFKFQVTYEMIDPFYKGEKTIQRDHHFLRSQLKEAKKHYKATFSHPFQKQQPAESAATEPQLPFTDRTLQSTG